MTEKYKSIEERMFVDSGIADSLKTCYGSVASLFRIPTAIRKKSNNQTILNKLNVHGYHYEGDLKKRMASRGMFAGLGADLTIGYCAVMEAAQGNYIPVIALGATNLASGLYELGRFSKSRKENLELKARQKHIKN